jgi:hypothetical protein
MTQSQYVSLKRELVLGIVLCAAIQSLVLKDGHAILLMTKVYAWEMNVGQQQPILTVQSLMNALQLSNVTQKLALVLTALHVNLPASVKTVFALNVH